MTEAALLATVAPRAAAGRSPVLVPMLIVIGATCFNAGLAAVNGNVTSLTEAPVVAAEVTFVCLAHLVAVTHYRREMAPWYVLLGLFVLFAVVRSLASQTIDVKYLRDVMIIPTFVVLGMTFEPRRLGRLFVIISAITLVFMILEAVDLDVYSSLFKIQDYYINTRGYTADNFWDKGSDLYVSATRPDGSFLAIVDLHRLSSIFLEPVSLGNYCMVVVAFLCAAWAELGRATRWFLAVATALATIGCDGRLALASAPVMVLCCALAPRLPRPASLLYIPGVLLLGVVLVSLGRFQPGGDDFPGRIAHTVFLLRSYGLSELLGLSDEFMSKAVDSGIAYLITTQSIFVVVALWATISLSAPSERPDKIKIVHAVAIYIALNMMVSFALLTIKTAALLWFAYGSILSRRPEGSRPRIPARRLDRRTIPMSAPPRSAVA